jgi:hypothetical protein
MLTGQGKAVLMELDYRQKPSILHEDNRKDDLRESQELVRPPSIAGSRV